jgi:hypothetical protein
VFIYAFSRAIYRELAEEIIEQPQSDAHLNHERVLRACEAAVQRLATDRRYFARPVRSLFCDIRMYFPMSSQARVLRVIEHFLGLADEYLQRLPQNGMDANGDPLQCRASTRRGTACQRMPLPLNGYCPSHQHLVETEDLPSRIAA